MVALARAESDNRDGEQSKRKKRQIRQKKKEDKGEQGGVGGYPISSFQFVVSFALPSLNRTLAPLKISGPWMNEPPSPSCRLLLSVERAEGGREREKSKREEDEAANLDLVLKQGTPDRCSPVVNEGGGGGEGMIWMRKDF